MATTTNDGRPYGSVMASMVGQRFGKWTVVGVVKGTGRVRVVCDCRTERDVNAKNIRRGVSTSCGCDRAEKVGAKKRTHGGSRTPEYEIWAGMIARCTRPTHQAFRNYGARGITVCDRWRDDFAAFMADMGTRPSPNHSIDRIDNDGNYEPGNCRWATAVEQQQHTRRTVELTLNGETLPVAGWARRLGISEHTLYGRLNLGWLPERVLTTPIRQNGRRAS